MQVDQVLLVREAERRQRRDGGDYMRVQLGDRTGTVSCMVWEELLDAEELIRAGEPVRVSGRYIVHPRFGPQINLTRLESAQRMAPLLVDQLTASIVWAKLVRRLVSQTNVVSDEEIDEASKRMKESANEPQSRVAEIFLAVDNPQQDDEVRRLAERLIEQMKRGARFSAVAQQFSQSATAAVGGDLGDQRPDPVELGRRHILRDRVHHREEPEIHGLRWHT